MDELSRKINILLDLDKQMLPKAEYVIRTFCKIIGFQPEFFYGYTLEDINVYYGVGKEDKYPIEIYHNPATAEYFENLSAYPENQVNFVKYRDEHIPFLFSKPGKLFHQTKQSLLIQKDIIASAFYFLSCWEEYLSLKKKSHSTSRKKEHTTKLSKVWGFTTIPVVDRYCDIFQKAVQIVFPGYQKVKKWHSEKNFTVAIAHKLILSEQEPELLEQMNKLFGSEDKKGAYSEVFLPVFKNSDEVIDETITDLLNKSNLNLFNSYLNEKTAGIYSEKVITSTEINEAIDNYSKNNINVKGYCLFKLNQHYGELINTLESTGMVYDMSIFYDDKVGYRAGISYPFFPYNIKGNKPFRVLEIPPCISYLPFEKESDNNRHLKNYSEYIFLDTIKHSALLSFISDNSQIFSKYYRYIFFKSIKNKGLVTSPSIIADNWLTR